jgi:hypothetical protein
MRTRADVQRDLKFARSNHEIVGTPATAAYVKQLERELKKAEEK